MPKQEFQNLNHRSKIHVILGKEPIGSFKIIRCFPSLHSKKTTLVLLLSFFSTFIEVQLIYNVVLVSGLMQSESVIYTHLSTTFQILSHTGYYRVLSIAPSVIQQALISYFIYSTAYMSTPVSQFIPPMLYPLVTISLFSTYVTLFLFVDKFVYTLLF